MRLRGFLAIAVIIFPVDLQGQSARTVPTELLKPVVAPFGDGVPKEIANRAFPAHQIIANIYYVGTVDYASFLITAPEGHILINPDWDDSVPLIRASVQQLGFRFEDSKIVLISHAHVDHVGGTAQTKILTGAQVMVMDRDVDVIEHGTDGGTVNVFAPVKVDRVLILAFAERILPRASDLWVQASLDYKQRLQQLFFPEGIAFDGNRFNRTAVTAPLFKYLAPSESADERVVTQTSASWNQIAGWLRRLNAVTGG